MKTTLLVQGGITYEDTYCNSWKSSERGVRQGDTRIIDDVLYYAGIVEKDWPWSTPRILWWKVNLAKLVQ